MLLLLPPPDEDAEEQVLLARVKCFDRRFGSLTDFLGDRCTKEMYPPPTHTAYPSLADPGSTPLRHALRERHTPRRYYYTLVSVVSLRPPLVTN